VTQFKEKEDFLKLIEGEVKELEAKREEIVSSYYNKVIESLLDPKDWQNFYLLDDGNKVTEFEQISVVPFDGNFYSIIRTAKTFEEIKEKQYMVLKLTDKDAGTYILKVVMDESIINKVYDIFNQKHKK
jgi:hypothetical protein